MNNKNDINILDSFSNLAPVSDGQNQEIYIDLLAKGVSDKDVKNIALTGSYGSGKSSILKRFLNELPKKDKDKYLEISLANFDKDSKEEEKEQSIERSILQQIFYKVSKDKVPYSKLNRTENKATGELWLYALLFFVWVVSFFVYKQRDAIHATLKTYDINIQTILLLGSIIPLLVTTFVIIYLILKGTGKIKLNKLSFQGVNLDLEENKEGSLLNQYLDEILYFFEATDYEVVIIEDLDRHEVTNIFQKLREINILLNSYEKIKSKKKVTFIYAVKDSIFTGEERTKFFEMVIPVIPIVNTSNAKDILIKKFEEAGLLEKIGKSFLKDISYYIKDLRQLTNIFNEYLVYHKSIDTKNQRELFSMIIYKNFFPQDFALLHNREGELYRIFNAGKEPLKERLLSSLNEKLNEVQSKLDAVETEVSESVKELKLLFLGKIINEHPDLMYFRDTNGSRMPIADIIYDDNEETFIMYLKGGSLNYDYDYYNQKNDKFNSHNTEYDKRLEIIKNKILEKEGRLTKELYEIQQQIRDIKYAPIVQLLKDDLSVLDLKDSEEKTNANNKDWSPEEKNNWKLIKHLIKNGYINEKYKEYISYFHEGDLTHVDHEFIIAIKDNESINFDYKLDNVSSVIEELDVKDFETENIINLDIAEYFFEYKTKYAEKRKIFIKTLFRSKNQELYYIMVEKNIKNKKFLLSFVNEILADDNMKLKSINGIFKRDRLLLQEVLIFILNNLNKFKLSSEDIDSLRILLKENLVEVYENLKDKDLVKEYLRKHKVLFDEITKELIKNSLLYDFVEKNFLYHLTIDNIKAIVDASSSKDWDHDLIYTQHITIIDSKKSNSNYHISEYRNKDINLYYRNIMLDLEDNSYESEETLLYLLNHEELKDDYKKDIIKKSKNKINSILNVENETLWNSLLVNNLIVAKWDNIFNYYIKIDEFDDALFNFLNSIDNAKELSKVKKLLSNKYFEEFNEFDKKGRKLIKQILERNDFDNDVYRVLIESYNFWYSDLDLSSLDDNKIKILIDTGRLMPNVEVYNTIEEQCIDCAVKFIERYFNKYKEGELNVDFDSMALVSLIKSTNLTKEDKKIIIEKTNNYNFEELKVIVEFYIEEKEKIPHDIFEELFYQDVLDNQYKLLILAYNIEYLSYEQVEEYLNELGTPYSEILEKTLKNLKINFESNIWTIVRYMSSKKWIGKVNKSKKDNEIIINRREKQI